MSGIDPRAVYDILVQECGAAERQYEAWGFGLHWPACGEWRFQGNQGFGGKVYAGGRSGPYVTCYPEDDNDERRAARERANARLTALFNGGAK